MQRIRSILATCVTIAALIGFGKTAHAELVTASHLDFSGGGFGAGAGKLMSPPNTYDRRSAQTFLASIGGAATTVSLSGFQTPGVNVDLRVDLATIEGGLPGLPLASVYVPSSEIPMRNEAALELNIHADFSSSGLVLQAGTSYTIILSTDTFNGNYFLDARYGYSQGTLYEANFDSPWEDSGGDLIFEVTVTPVPEPSTWMLAVVGCTLAAIVVRKRTRI